MAQDNPRTIISVSAFGFGDSINGQPMVKDATTPSVIIEDPDHKVFLYGQRAQTERTSSGLISTLQAPAASSSPSLGASLSSSMAPSANAESGRIMVALLWQQLKDSPNPEVKQEAANRISRHVIQSICDQQFTGLQTRSELRAKAQIVLLIPDNFTEAEQQCLLNAFLGYEIRLLWRSVAALIGCLTPLGSDSLHSRVERFRDITQVERPLVHVLYIGADSIDLSSYEIKFEQGSQYLIPVRLKAVYQECSLGLNFLHYALSAAHNRARKVCFQSMELMRDSAKQALIERLLTQQQLAQNAEIWGFKPEHDQDVVKLAADNYYAWVQLEAITPNEAIGQRLHHIDIQDFYQQFGLKPQLPHATNSSNDRIVGGSSSGINPRTNQQTSFVEQVAQAITQMFASGATGSKHAQQQGFPTFCFIVGPEQLVQENLVFKTINQLLSSDRSHHYHIIANKSLGLGGRIFQERLNRGLSTYLDRLPKLSMIVVNENQDGYQERVLIEDKEISPQDVVTGTVGQKIVQGASGIELYVSADPNFNDETIEQATDVSFAQQGISVKKAELAFSSGLKAENDEPVTVSALQRPLSGYVKIKIKPQGESQLLPPYGVTRDFDPVKSPDFTGCLEHLARAYPPLAKPDAGCWITAQDGRYSNLTSNQLRLENTIFASSSHYPSLVYYNGKFVSDYESIVRQRLESDRRKLYPKLVYDCQHNDLKQFASDLRQCLPFTMYCPFGWDHDTQLVDLIQYMIKYALRWDRGASHHLIRAYCGYVADHPQDVTKCCQQFLALSELNSIHLFGIRRLLENHPRCFKPGSADFCLSREFAWLMVNSSLAILSKSLKEVTAKVLINYLTVKGSRTLSISLIILMYSLLYRCQDRDFLASERELTEVENLLHAVETHYSQVADEVYRSRANNEFKSRLQEFVNNKLKKLVPQVIEFLKKEGTNSNIMAELTELNVEGN